MPSEVGQAGVNSIGHFTFVRTIRHKIQIWAEDERSREALAFVSASPQMDVAPSQALHIEVHRVDDFYEALFPSEVVIEGSISYIVTQLLRFLSLVLEEEASEGAVIPAASVVLSGERTLLIGGPGDARTRLLLRLLEVGEDVEGDQNVSVDSFAAVTAWPLPLRVTSTALRMLPECSDRVLSSPSLVDCFGHTIYSVIPSRSGTPWRIGTGRARNLVFIDDNEGGRCLMSPIKPEAAFQRLLTHSVLPKSGRGAWTAVLADMLSGAEVFRLALGESMDDVARRLTRGVRAG